MLIISWDTVSSFWSVEDSNIKLLVLIFSLVDGILVSNIDSLCFKISGLFIKREEIGKILLSKKLDYYPKI